MEAMSALTEAQREWFWRIWRLGQSDAAYDDMLQKLKPIERRYEEILQTLPDEQRDIICDFVSQCEEMSWRMLEIACTYMRFPK